MLPIIQRGFFELYTMVSSIRYFARNFSKIVCFFLIFAPYIITHPLQSVQEAERVGTVSDRMARHGVHSFMSCVCKL